MKWLWGIMTGMLLVGLSSSLGFSARPPMMDEPPPKGLKTKTEMEYKYVKESGEYQKVLKHKTIANYDKTGNRIEWQTYNYKRVTGQDIIDEQFKCIGEIIYDAQGNLIECRTYRDDGRLVSKTIYEYDDQGNLISEGLVSPGEDKASRTWIHKYDEHGNEIEGEIYAIDDNGKKLIFKTISKYDDAGNRVEHVEYKRDGSVMLKRTLEYDDKGNKIETQGYDDDGNPFNHTRLSGYDRQGNLIAEVTYNPKKGGVTRLKLYKYDSKGHKIEKNDYSQGRLCWKQTWKYDDQGNLTEETHYDIEHEGDKDIAIPREQTTYEYEFYPEESKEDK